MKNNTLKGLFPIIFITIVVLISVSLLTLTDIITRDKISLQAELKIQIMLEEMFPSMTQYNLDSNTEIYTIYTDGQKTGYAFLAKGKGYGGEIRILVGLEDETTVKGIKIITQSETPGLGTRIAESPFIDLFSGITINDISLRKDGGQIDSITGATISSVAVINAVREEALRKVQLLNESE